MLLLGAGWSVARCFFSLSLSLLTLAAAA
uniref:Uncharacterized protein n=1 Tax=Arundo donax TaxID=35708 RepID=A0A0A9P369_ARUDO